jgi:HEAT repeat protein
MLSGRLKERIMGLVKQKVVQLVDRGETKLEPDRNELETALENADAAGRRQAARDMVHCPGTGTALVSRLKRESDGAVREVILNTLVSLNDPAAVSGLVDCLRSEDAALRNETIEAFKHLGNKVDPILHSLLSDPDPDVRIFVVNILDSARHSEAESWLIKVIEEDCHVNVCATAVDLLCGVGTEAAIDPILRLKARFASEDYIQFASDLALKRIREV